MKKPSREDSAECLTEGREESIISSFRLLNLKLAFEERYLHSYLGKLILKLVSKPAIGYLVFKASMLQKRFSLLLGLWTQRVIEYPWVLKQLNLIKRGSLVLDIGCAESLLADALLVRKLEVISIDIRQYLFRSDQLTFLQQNVLELGIRSGTFDAIVIVSTIEHVGLSAYGQLTLNDEADMRAMKEIRRILKPGGIIIMTTPYVGGNGIRLNAFERNYNRRRLEKLLDGFQLLCEDYFYPVRQGRSLTWMRKNRKEIDGCTFAEPGIACLMATRVPTRSDASTDRTFEE